MSGGCRRRRAVGRGPQEERRPGGPAGGTTSGGSRRRNDVRGVPQEERRPGGRAGGTTGGGARREMRARGQAGEKLCGGRCSRAGELGERSMESSLGLRASAAEIRAHGQTTD